MGRKPYKARVAAQAASKEPIPQEIIKEPTPTFLYKVQVTYPSLRIRRGPSLRDPQIGLITDMGVYEILEESNGFGRIKDNAWIMLQYTKKIK